LGKGKMLSPDVVADITGHPVGGCVSGSGSHQ
jgi:hypothetical protein